MRTEELQNFIENNSEIGIDLEQASREIPKIQSKAINYKLIEQGILKSLELKLEQQMRDKWLYYSGKADPEVYREKPFDLKVLKGDVERFVQGDDEVQKTKSQILIQENKLDILNEFIKTLNQRGYLIHSIIEVQKMNKGII